MGNQLRLPWWFAIAACRPEVSSIDVTNWVPGDPGLEAEFEAAARAKADGVTPVDHAYAAYFCDVPAATVQPTDIARELCAQCPAIVQCVDASVKDGTERYGLLGGLGENERRVLRKLRGDPSTCAAYTGCGCGYCARVDEFTDVVAPDRARNTAGAGARCCRVASYARGHRDTACTFAMAITARRSNLMPEHTEPRPVPKIRAQRVPPCVHGPTQCRSCEHTNLYRAARAKVAA